MENLYDILQVSEKASDEIIEKVYKTLAKKYHPDVAKSKAEAENMMKKINAAYDILGNKDKRAEYDIQLQQERAIIEQERNAITNSTENYDSQDMNQYTYKTNDPDYGNYYDYINKFDFSRIKNMDDESKRMILLIGIVIVICIIVLISSINSIFGRGTNNNVVVDSPTTSNEENIPEDITNEAPIVIVDEIPNQLVMELLQSIKNFNPEGIKKNISGSQILTDNDIEIINNNIEFYNMLTDKLTFEYYSSNIMLDRATVTYNVTNMNITNIMSDIYDETYLNTTSQPIKEVFQASYANNIDKMKTERITFDLLKIDGEWTIRLLPTDVVGIVGARFGNLANIFSKF